MPYVADDDVHLVRKRRWLDDEPPLFQLPNEDGSGDIYLLPQGQQHTKSPPRRILPLSKRLKIAKPDDTQGAHDAPAVSTSRRRSHGGRAEDSKSNAIVAASTALTPCHMCHRRPTKSTLDSFAECEGCGERTCFICLRDCQGWALSRDIALSEQEALSTSFQMEDAHEMEDGERDTTEEETNARPAEQARCRKKGWDAEGHRRVVCSGCCVERGPSGDVVCFGCLPALDTA